MRMILLSGALALCGGAGGCAGLQRPQADCDPCSVGCLVQEPGADTPRARPRAPADEQVADEQVAVAATPAAAPGPQAAGALGRTVAALGDVRRPGLWLRTPLVDRERPGEVVTGQGRRLALTLLPLEGAAPGAGSQISREALQALGLSLAALVELEVRAGAGG
ncbi:MAG: hypothetical protein JJU40_03355 [Rhodobacteraceae bacterium]|nr:hypothetical protein [Paracoccaceae bacterium]